jgi:hypothetical protein
MRTLVTVDGRLMLGKPHCFSTREVRDLTARGSRSLLEAFKAKRGLAEKAADKPRPQSGQG